MVAPARDAAPQALVVATSAPVAPTLRSEPKAKAKAKRAAATKKPTKTRKKLHLRTRELTRFRCQNLELDIMNLRQEIASLERARSVLYARTLNRADALDGSVLKTIRQFYRLMRHGFNDVVWLDDEDGSGPRPLDFRQFIYASFDDVLALGPDVSQRRPRGRDHLIEHFCHMTALTGAPNVEMVDVRIHSSRDSRTATVVVKTTCTSPLSVLMLEAKYAHVSLYPELKAKLVGRTIVAYGEARYVFDLKTGRIVLADVQADHASAILQVVDTADEYEILYGGSSNVAFAELLENASSKNRSGATIDVWDPPCAGVQSSAPVSSMSLEFVLSPDSDDEER